MTPTFSLSVVLLIVIADIVVGIVTLSSYRWVTYCTDFDVCKVTARAGLINSETYCLHERRCVDAMHFGVFMLLCISMACRGWFLYTTGKALYYSATSTPSDPKIFVRIINGLVACLEIVTVIIAQYTFFLVVFLKLNGDQHGSFSDAGWPFYLNWASIAFVIMAVYAQPTDYHPPLDVVQGKLRSTRPAWR